MLALDIEAHGAVVRGHRGDAGVVTVEVVGSTARWAFPAAPDLDVEETHRLLQVVLADPRLAAPEAALLGADLLTCWAARRAGWRRSVPGELRRGEGPDDLRSLLPLKRERLLASRVAPEGHHLYKVGGQGWRLATPPDPEVVETVVAVVGVVADLVAFFGPALRLGSVLFDRTEQMRGTGQLADADPLAGRIWLDPGLLSAEGIAEARRRPSAAAGWPLAAGRSELDHLVAAQAWRIVEQFVVGAAARSTDRAIAVDEALGRRSGEPGTTSTRTAAAEFARWWCDPAPPAPVARFGRLLGEWFSPGPAGSGS